MQPGLAVIAGEPQHGPVRAVDDDGCLGGRALLAERVAVMPHGAGVRTGLRRGNCGHVFNFTGLRFLAMASVPGVPGVVVTLDGELHEPAAPLVHADDLAVVRGDGIFESLLVRDGRPCLLEAHLARLTQSARMTDLPAPDLPRWRAAAATAASSDGSPTGGDEGVLRLMYSRGRESGSPPTGVGDIMHGFGAVRAAARVAGARRNGLAALTLARGLPAEGAADMPWLLAGAKTLSYAVNMAALRHAERHGAGDVIFVSSDGLHPGGPALDGRDRHRDRNGAGLRTIHPAAVVSDPAWHHAAGAVRGGPEQGLRLRLPRPASR